MAGWKADDITVAGCVFVVPDKYLPEAMRDGVSMGVSTTYLTKAVALADAGKRGPPLLVPAQRESARA